MCDIFDLVATRNQSDEVLCVYMFVNVNSPQLVLIFHLLIRLYVQFCFPSIFVIDSGNMVDQGKSKSIM